MGYELCVFLGIVSRVQLEAVGVGYLDILDGELGEFLDFGARDPGRFCGQETLEGLIELGKRGSHL
jgi:hypothetical protein